MIKENSLALILIGSDSDLPIIKPAVEMLRNFEIPFDIEITSAHRSPQRTTDIVREASSKNIKVFIVGAGMAAHLAGVVAAGTILPVIGIPIDSSPLNGIDALHATVQMPQGIPVATMAIGKSGAGNAAILAAQILALSDANLQKKLEKFKKELAQKVEKKSEALKDALKNI